MLSGLRSYWHGQIDWWRSRSLEWWAAHITAFYVASAFMVIGAKLDELVLLKLNEIGDLSAGIFGPVAFLWLVLGYIQQGRELRLSSEALRLQANELRESVKQQMELNYVTRQSLKNQNLGLEPAFHILFQDITDEFYQGDHYESANFQLWNFGAHCEHIAVCVMSAQGAELIAYKYPLFTRDDRRPLSLLDTLYQGEVVELRISYVKLNGESGTQVFDLEKIPECDEEVSYVKISKRIIANHSS